MRCAERTRKASQYWGLVLLCALVLCGQIGSAQHLDAECEHEECLLCVALVDDAAVPTSSTESTVQLPLLVQRLAVLRRAPQTPRTAARIRAPPCSSMQTI